MTSTAIGRFASIVDRLEGGSTAITVHHPTQFTVRLRQPRPADTYPGPMSSRIIAALAAGTLLLSQSSAPRNAFPWSLVTIAVTGAGVLAVGGYLVARFLANRQRADSEDT